jgi:sec-independent protein translocase protein TatA
MFEGLLQPTHLVIILVIGLIVFGPGKVGELGGQLGRGMREFKQNLNDAEKPVALSAGGRTCTQCGAPNDSSARFCAKCGTTAAGTV